MLSWSNVCGMDLRLTGRCSEERPAVLSSGAVRSALLP